MLRTAGISWIAFLCVTAVAVEEPLTQVTLDDAKQFAVNHNPQVLALRRDVDEKLALVGRARSAFFPTLGVAGGAEYGQGGQAAPLAFGYASYNFFRGFADTYRSQIANVDHEMAEVKLTQAEFRVGLDVEKQFHLYIFKKTSLAIKTEALKLNQAHRSMAAARRASGISSTSDVMEFDLRDALLRSDVELLKQEIEEARIRFRMLLGEQIGAAIEPVGELQHQHLKGNLMDYLRKLKETSETVKLASRELARASIESKVWLSSWLPQFDVEAQVGYLTLDQRPIPTAGAGIRVVALARFDLFNGFRNTYERREGAAKQMRAEANLKGVLQGALSDTEIGVRRLITIQHRVDLEEQNEERASRYYDAVVAEYRRGIKNSADVKMASDALHEARLRSESFKHDFLDSKIELERAIGTSIDSEVVTQ